ncbi:ArsR family transcriptional regulator [Actinoallomurus iriomotensis]|uniref:ArsR family transcriptional regulator n=2 Tax=Actinoallomurus iriomotensis TaxID=478107 RepID=A0A9W6SAV1_9ACTN|nr:ArsR family transcriptional regulator [Actinoallomurus iriomotensis]
MAVMRLVVSGGDLLRCRFATSPLWETVNAVRAFVDPRSHPYLRPWWEQVRDDPPADELLAVQSPRGYTPDFLSPPPREAAPSVEDQLAAVRATPPGQVRAELRRVDLATCPSPAAVRAMIADPETARDVLAAGLEDAWRRLVLPWWPRVRELIDGDIEYRSRLVAAYGLGHVVAGLDERVRWSGQSIVIEPAGGDVERELDGDGLILMPSAFVWPSVTAVVDRPWQPTLIYPARGIGALLGGRVTAPAPLARLLGRTRGLILADLAEPATTAALAARHGLAPSTVSAHLSALEGAGLLTRRRTGHEVRYRHTPLGRALAEGLMPGE